MNYIVTDSNTNQLIQASSVQTAVNKVPDDQKLILLGFRVDGSFIQSPSIPTTTLAAGTPDNRLWIIGAVLGPVAFVVLLVCLALCLHFKFRGRDSGESIAQVSVFELYFFL